MAIKINAIFAKRKGTGRKIASSTRSGLKRKIISFLCAMKLTSLKFLIMFGGLIVALQFTFPKLCRDF